MLNLFHGNTWHLKINVILNFHKFYDSHILIANGPLYNLDAFHIYNGVQCILIFCESYTKVVKNKYHKIGIWP
jgi:hypothetical protein